MSQPNIHAEMEAYTESIESLLKKKILNALEEYDDDFYGNEAIRKDKLKEIISNI